jgi:hypothetical protein
LVVVLSKIALSLSAPLRDGSVAETCRGPIDCTDLAADPV